jgi:hypothetical protein
VNVRNQSRRRKSVGGALALALVLGLGAAGWVTASAGAQAGGNAGDVKLHDISQAIGDNSDNPKPCDPVLVSFNFEIGQQYTYEFITQPGGAQVIAPTTVTVTTVPQQEPPAGDFHPPLVDGQQYKLRWDAGTSLAGGTKQKVFRIDCDEPDPQDPDPGSFEVTKTVSGPSAPADWAFDVSIACSDGSASDVTLTDEEPTATLTNLDAGTTCTVDEPDTQGATPTYSPSQTSGPVPEGGTATVVIDNSFAEVGGIESESPPTALVGVTPSFTG